MSDKVLIWSDLHIHPLGNDWRKVDDAIEILDWVKQTAIDRDIKTIFFLGDWFHVRGYMYPSVVAQTYHKLLEFKEAGLEMCLLVGNHDMPYKNTTKHNCLTVYNSVYPVVEQPQVFEGESTNFYMLPYVENPEQLQWALGEIVKKKDPNKKNVLLAHLDINKALFHTNVQSNHGVESDFLSKNFDLVVTGHYHIPQQVRENVWYVGSPFQQNFGETEQDKGIMIYDDGELEYIENKFSPRYLYITPDQIDERITGNYVKIQAEPKDNIAALKAQAAKYSPRSASVSISRDADAAGESLAQLKSSARDVKSLLREWVNKSANPNLYDRDYLFEYGMGIVNALEKE